MAFTDGFTKTAGVGSTAKAALKGLVNLPVRAATGLAYGAGKLTRWGIHGGSEVGDWAVRSGKEVGRGAVKGYGQTGRMSISGRIRPERGETLQKAQERKLQKNIRGSKLKNYEAKEFKHAPEMNDKELNRALMTGEKEQLRESNLDRIKNRKGKIWEASKGPSWAVRHPFITAGAGLLAGKAIFGDKKEEPQPQVIYPQQ